MTHPVFDPVIDPSSIKKTVTAKLLKAEFGDGYTQIARDGLNSIRTTLDLEWEVLLPAQSASILDFFEERGGALPFEYAGRLFTCAEWRETTARNNLRSISATFTQSFTP